MGAVAKALSRYRPNNSMSMSESNRIGTLAELSVQRDLLNNGFNVSVPIDDYSYDLIAEWDGEFTRIQVKNGHIKDNSLRASLDSYIRGENKEYKDDDFDILAVYHPDCDDCYYADWSEIGNTMFQVYIGDMDELMPMHLAQTNLPSEHKIDKLK